MYRTVFAALILAATSSAGLAQLSPEKAPGAKANATPCSEEVAASLKKLRSSSWFRMDSKMITENGPTSMQVDYVLPDRMHQMITNVLTQKISEIILIGDKGWSRQGTDAWQPLPPPVAQQLKDQFEENVLREQTDIGEYACKGRTQIEGRDVLSYKLDTEPEKGKSNQGQTFRMFYVDVLTGLPVSNALLVPGHEERPIFKTTYAFPLDLKIDPPTDIAKTAPAAAAPAPAAPAPTSPAPSNK